MACSGSGWRVARGEGVLSIAKQAQILLLRRNGRLLRLVSRHNQRFFNGGYLPVKQLHTPFLGHGFGVGFLLRGYEQPEGWLEEWKDVLELITANDKAEAGKDGMSEGLVRGNGGRRWKQTQSGTVEESKSGRRSGRQALATLPRQTVLWTADPSLSAGPWADE